MNHPVHVLRGACNALSSGDVKRASTLIQEHYPFKPLGNSGRKYTASECTRVFIRDGFLDRYSGDRLIFPGVLRLLAKVIPDAVPFQLNWKMSETHPAFWELFPTIDHVVPVARGGADDESNWVSTSMLRNSAKSNWTLEEIGWQLVAPGDLSDWDGLLGWFLGYMDGEPEHQKDPYLRKWYRAGKAQWAHVMPVPAEVMEG